ncbi:MAG TPA: TMEM175 family protein [Solirubrobacteraceae bacterium]
MAEDLGFDQKETLDERAFDYARTVALSDGVFAIALTLLVLNITVPELAKSDHGELGKRLIEHRQEFVSYAISFAVVSVFWVRHHVFFRRVSRIDARLAVINLGYLAFIAFVPYPTRLVGIYGDEPAAVVLYAATLAIIATLAGGMRLYGRRAGLLTAQGLREIDRREHWLVAPAIFLLSIPIAFVSATAAQLMWLLVLLPRAGQRLGRLQPRRHTKHDD